MCYEDYFDGLVDVLSGHTYAQAKIFLFLTNSTRGYPLNVGFGTTLLLDFRSRQISALIHISYISVCWKSYETSLSVRYHSFIFHFDLTGSVTAGMFPFCPICNFIYHAVEHSGDFSVQEFGVIVHEVYILEIYLGGVNMFTTSVGQGSYN